MNIKLLKTTPGEWIIGDVDINNSGYTVTKPYVLIPNPQGHGVAITPYAPFASTMEVYFPDNAVMHVLDPDSRLANLYREQVTGIVTAATMPTLRENIRRNGAD